MIKTDYRTTVFHLSRQLHRLRELASKLELPSLVERIDFVVGQLEAHKFTVAVVGEFKRGKSTFINALLGREVLPADVLPTSATLNRVTYGDKHVEIYFKANPGEAERLERISVDRLTEFVTKLTPEAESVAAMVREAVVYYPAPFCKNYNTDIFDTPGLGDEATMTDVTMRVLPQVDATVMVVMANAPFADSEGKFVWELLQRGLPTPLFVINAIDRVREQQRERLIGDIRNRIESSIQRYAETTYKLNTPQYDAFMKRYGQVRLFALSSFQALEGKITNNADLLETSAFSQFEESLEKFLAEESSAIALQARARDTVAIGQNIQRYLATRLEEVSQRKLTLRHMETQLMSLLQQVLRSGQSELQQMSDTDNQIEAQLRPMFDQFVRELKSALQKTSNTVTITQDEWKDAEASSKFDTIQQRLLTAYEVEIHRLNAQFADQTAAMAETVISTNLQARAAFMFTYDRVIQHLARQGYIVNEQSRAPLTTTFGLPPLLSGNGTPLIQVSRGPIVTALNAVKLRALCTEAISAAQVGVIPGKNRFARLAQVALGVTGFKLALNNELSKLVDAHIATHVPFDTVYAALNSALNETLRVLTSALDEVQTHLLELHGHQERVAGLTEREVTDLKSNLDELNSIIEYGQALTKAE